MPTWQKSSFSGGGDGDHCIEVANLDGERVALRESDAPSLTLETSPEALAALIRPVKRAQLTKRPGGA